MWQELIETLNELNKTYCALIALSEKKHKALIVIDLKSIEAVNGEEAKLTQRIRALETKRQKALIDLAVENRAITKDTKMKDLARFAPTPNHRLLIEKLHAALDTSTKRAQELAENNRVLIEGALSAVTYHLNRIGGTTVQPSYGRAGETGVQQRRRLNFEV